MNDLTFSRHIKINSFHRLKNGLDFEKDKVPDDSPEEADRLRQQLQEHRQAFKNRHFDPSYMECNLPESPDTGNISLNPDDMTFNFD